MNRNHRYERIRKSTPAVEAAARELRATATTSEQILWQALRNHQLGGYKFRRQHPVGRFILDFYCPSHHLVVELDGASHRQKQEYDRYRTEYLGAFGCCVLRFMNDEVIQDLAGVLARILSTLHKIDKQRNP